MINHCSSALVCTKLLNKMKSITKILLYFSFVILAPWLADAATDYCKTSLCDDGEKHIGCTNKNRHFGKACPSDAQLVEITPTLQNLIVDEFNEKRNFIAGGNAPQLEPACRMGTMKWDKELAELAELLVMQCEFYQACHNTESYHLSGLSLANTTYRKCNRDTDIEKLIGSVDMWYNQVKDVKPSTIKKLPEYSGGPSVHAFATMMTERNIAVGCAACKYSINRGESEAYFVACNFAYESFIDCAVYKTCPTPGEECETGKNPKYPNLCSTSEEYAVNEYPEI